MAEPEGLTDDRLLGGRVQLRQPRQGYRAATDPVLLAAAVPARAGQTVLDLGCGAGAAALCLAARVPGVVVAGLEIQAAYAGLARWNAAENGVALEVHEGDVAAPPVALRAMQFDHLLTNPPYFGAAETSAPPDAGRARAHQFGAGELAAFLDQGLRRLKPRGTLTVIQRAEHLGGILENLSGRAGDIRILPLTARAGRPAKRVIVQARKEARGPLRLLAPFVLHDGPTHLEDRPDWSAEARRVLEDAAALDLD